MGVGHFIGSPRGSGGSHIGAINMHVYKVKLIFFDNLMVPNNVLKSY